jgi:hypothetical protein
MTIGRCLHTDRHKERYKEKDYKQRQKEKTTARCLHTDRGKDIKEKEDKQRQKGMDEGEMRTER